MARDMSVRGDPAKTPVLNAVRCQPALPDLAHHEVVEYVAEPGYVVRVRVGKHHHVEPAYAMVPEVRGDRGPARVQPDWVAAPVYQHPLPARQLHERAVALAHV